MKKFTVICITIDFLSKESNTQILHLHAGTASNAIRQCKKVHPAVIIVAIFTGWHDEA